jgi:cytochrome c oxidase subunit IV
MRSYVRNRLTYVWLFLCVITVISWWTVSGHGANYPANVRVTAVVLTIALIKTRFVIRNFMEVRRAPLWLRLTCDAWLLYLFAVISYFYWFGSDH